MFGVFKKLFKDERGQGMTEYGLIIALVAIAVIAALVLLGGKLKGVFESISNSLGGNSTNTP